jgi:hypothetical protein
MLSTMREATKLIDLYFRKKLIDRQVIQVKHDFMKKITLLLFLSLLVSPCLFSQAISYDIKLKYHGEATGTTADITIVVTSGNAEFTYSIMTNDPLHGQVLQTSGPVKNKSYTFKGVKPGKYFIRITDKNGLPAGRTIEVLENDSSSN